MTLCYIGLGSNLATPKVQLEQACQALKKLNQLTDFKVSSLYASKPMGPQDQPDYINAVARFHWQAEPIELLNALQKIEQEHGRVRKETQWGPRTLDLDILLFGQITLATERLIVPHYGLKLREFVLYPLYELDPNCVLPDGDTVAELIKQVPLNGLSPLKHD